MLRPMRALALVCLVACSGGENRPPATQADATLPRATAPDGGTATATPVEGPVFCEPYSVCGCEEGCVAVRRLDDRRYRVEAGRMAGEILVRDAPDMPLHREAAESCDESCRPAPATRTCGMTGEACAEVSPGP